MLAGGRPRRIAAQPARLLYIDLQTFSQNENEKIIQRRTLFKEERMNDELRKGILRNVYTFDISRFCAYTATPVP